MPIDHGNSTIPPERPSRRHRIRHHRHFRKALVAAMVVVTASSAGGYKAVTACGCATPDFLSTALTAPADSATVSGTVAVTADCRYGTAVQFKLNGGNLQAEDTSSPYSVNWNADSSGAGTWTLGATCRDVYGRIRTATTRTVTVTPGGAAPDVANFWVDTNGGTCSRNSSPASYSDAAACASLSAAYTAATVGDLVLIKSGSYGQQVITYTAAKASGSHCDWNSTNLASTSSSFVADYSGCITFAAASGEAVKIGGLILEVPYVRLNGTANGGTITFDRTDAAAPITTSYCDNTATGPTNCTYGDAEISFGRSPIAGSYNCLGDTTGGKPQEQPHDDVVQNVVSNDAVVLGGRHNAFLNSTITVGDNFRPDVATSFVGGSCGNLAAAVSQYLLFKGNTLKDGTQTYASNGAGCRAWTCLHSEAIHHLSGQHTLIDGNRFLNLTGHAFFGESQQQGGMTDTVTQNNLVDYPCSHQPGALYCTQGSPWFGFTAHGYAIDGAVCRFNTFFDSVATSNGGRACGWGIDTSTLTNSVETGNVMMDGWSSCTGFTTLSITVAYETWGTGSNCGTGSQVAAANLTDIVNYDGTPLGGSPVLNFVPTSVTGGYPSTDIASNARPAGGGSFLDGGAYEVP